jgi:pimeloyl-ACP methyl ester carboxylesterase
VTRTRIRFRPSSGPAPEPLEARALTAVVLIFNGNALGPTTPDANTSRFAAQLRAAGHKAVEVPLGPVTSGLMAQLGRKVDRMAARGDEVAVAGLSAGGTVAARLAMRGHAVVAALDCYGPLDLADWMAYHRSRRSAFSRQALGIVGGNLGAGARRTIDALSGPAADRATPILAAFGERDRNVTIGINQESARKSRANVTVMTYPGGHGVAPPRAVVAAFLELLEAVENGDRRSAV